MIFTRTKLSARREKQGDVDEADLSALLASSNPFIYLSAIAKNSIPVNSMLSARKLEMRPHRPKTLDMSRDSASPFRSREDSEVGEDFGLMQHDRVSYIRH